MSDEESFPLGRFLVLMQFADGLLFVMSNEATTEFELHVGSEVFSSAESSVFQTEGNGRYWWPAPTPLWADGDVVEVAIWTPADAADAVQRPKAPPAERYRVEKYLVADAADVDGDCVDDLTELAGMPNLSPVNSAMAIDAPDGTLSVTDLATFSALAYTRPYETSGTTTALGVKFLATDMDTDRPGLYLLNANKYAYHFAVIDARPPRQ